ncbi:hypothetical protein Hanom_Chr14g01314901 [Helianthus anomalus]
MSSLYQITSPNRCVFEINISRIVFLINTSIAPSVVPCLPAFANPRYWPTYQTCIWKIKSFDFDQGKHLQPKNVNTNN